MFYIELKERHHEILEIVKREGPITSEQIASLLNITRSAIRSDLNLLTMSGMLEAKPKVGYMYVGSMERQKIADYLNAIRVGDLKSRPVAILETTSVYDAVVLMFLEDVGSIFITNEEHYLSGIISRKDLLKAAIGGGDIHQMPVGIIMTRMPNVVTVAPSEPVVEAARKIMEHEIDALPVVDEIFRNGQVFYRIVGRFSKTNITKLFVEIGNKLGGDWFE
ncbi:helix-turn-helix transcriptional regulator [Acidaminobacter hydrogenoformans]|uniref:CBS domain-containing protein n=1 Tax=Acidaminobacter hydrogenoformans DSM 2784 TaxID=1120920 RepID=A0A1G5RTH5_9FIRM|nr:helix-turn-helix transcriptional regulator [Acidaminobacter hydrogenoformans]SCZ77148.1 CBS domain-containing protein [Acidaminobacter hydrogenoformans DSM 2784]